MRDRRNNKFAPEEQSEAKHTHVIRLVGRSVEDLLLETGMCVSGAAARRATLSRSVRVHGQADLNPFRPEPVRPGHVVSEADLDSHGNLHILLGRKVARILVED